MSLNVNDELTINGVTYRVTPPPTAPGFFHSRTAAIYHQRGAAADARGAYKHCAQRCLLARRPRAGLRVARRHRAPVGSAMNLELISKKTNVLAKS